MMEAVFVALMTTTTTTTAATMETTTTTTMMMMKMMMMMMCVGVCVSVYNAKMGSYTVNIYVGSQPTIITSYYFQAQLF